MLAASCCSSAASMAAFVFGMTRMSFLQVADQFSRSSLALGDPVSSAWSSMRAFASAMSCSRWTGSATTISVLMRDWKTPSSS